MHECPTCGLPMIWSEDRERVWCAVYGDHRQPQQIKTNVMRRRWLSTSDTTPCPRNAHPRPHLIHNPTPGQ